jgi:hypothetical protein
MIIEKVYDFRSQKAAILRRPCTKSGHKRFIVLACKIPGLKSFKYYFFGIFTFYIISPVMIVIRKSELAEII